MNAKSWAFILILWSRESDSRSRVCACVEITIPEVEAKKLETVKAMIKYIVQRR